MLLSRYRRVKPLETGVEVELLSCSDRSGESQLDWTCLRRNVDVEEQEEVDLESPIVELSVL